MSNPRWININNSETAVLFDTKKYYVDRRKISNSPIDDLIIYFRSILPLATPESLNSNDNLGRVLLLGLVSGVESYFRSLIASLIRVCPISRLNASKYTLSLGSLDYYGPIDVGYGLLENTSFSSEGEILKVTHNIIGVDWKANTSVAYAIAELERLSQLRHAAVHSRGDLNARNTQAIGATLEQRLSLIVRFPELQTAAQICINAARAYNRYVFRKLVERWIGEKIFKGIWNLDKQQFGKLYSLFLCREDSYGGVRYKKFIYNELLPSIQASMKSK